MRGRYLLGERLGVGDVTEVFLAELEGVGEFRRKLVLKCLRDDLADREDRIRTFVEEASLVANLRHPNIVQVLDVAREDDAYFMALELVDGPSLSNLLGYTAGVGIALPIGLGAHIVVEAARGLHFAHEATGPDGELLGVVHRDVRPANVFLSRLGEVKVADFSIALSSASRWTTEARMDAGHGYRSPEQVSGAAVDRRSDVFSLGVILWEIATGKRLFQSDDHSPDDTVPPPSQQVPGLDPDLDRIVACATACDPAGRYPTAEALADDLAEWLVATRRAAGRIDLARWMRSSCPDLVPAGVRAPAAGRAVSELPDSLQSTGLPARNDELVGRTLELAQMDAALTRGRRLITLSGSGGVGKSCLALEWAAQTQQRMAARAIYCDAQHARTAEDLAHLVIAKLAPSSVQPRASRDPIAHARELLTSGGPTIVVIDQLDQLLEEAPSLLARWVDPALDVFYVVTSRAPLRLPHAEIIRLKALTAPEGSALEGPAAELFFARLGEVGGDEAVARWRDPARQPEVEQVLRGLEGFPLAIVVTASRAAEGTPDRMARERETMAPPGAPARPADDATAAALRRAWSSCEPRERAALLQCTVFYGPFTAKAAVAVLAIEGEVAPTLAALVEKSLLDIDGGTFRLHQSVRDLCSAIVMPDELGEIRERHLRHVLAHCEELLRELRGPGARRAFALLEASEPELRGIHDAALASGDGATALRAVLCLEPTLARRGDHRSLIRQLESAGERCRSSSISARGAMAEARAKGWIFEFQPALDAARRALVFAARSEAADLIAEARSELAMVEVRRGHGEDAAQRYRDALAAMREAGDRRGEGVVLLRLANLLSERGEAQAATMMYRVALEASRDAQDRVYEGLILSNLGAQLIDDGRPDQAHQALYVSEEIFRELGDERYGAVSRGLSGLSVALQGNWEQGSEIVEDALQTLRQVGERGVIVFFLGVLVSAKARLGDAGAARQWAAHMDVLGDLLAGTPMEHIAKVRQGHLELLEAQDAAADGRSADAQRWIFAARKRATEAPREVLTTLRIAAADLFSHCESVEGALFPKRSKRVSVGKLQRVKRPTIIEE